MEKVLKVRVNTKKGDKFFVVLMEESTLKLGKRLKVYAAKDGYLMYKDKFGQVKSFARYVKAVVNDDEVVTFKNGNHLDFTLDYLEVVTKGERGMRNLNSTKQQKIEPGIYYLEREKQYMVSIVDKWGKRHCPRCKTLEQARETLKKLQDIYKK